MTVQSDTRPRASEFKKARAFRDRRTGRTVRAIPVPGADAWWVRNEERRTFVVTGRLFPEEFTEVYQ